MTTRDVLGVPRRLAVLGAAAGLTIGVVHALSPMTVWLLVWMTVLAAYLWRHSGPRERRWLMALLVAALVLRLAVIAGLFLWLDPNQHYFASFPFDGDGRYIKRRAAWIRNVWLGRAMLSSDYQQAFEPGYGWSSYLYVVAYLQYLVGLTPFGAHLFNVGLFMTSGTVMHRLVRSAYGPVAACVGFALVLFTPSLMLWSVSALKESFHLLLISLAIVAAVRMVRGRSWPSKLFAAAALVALLAVLDSVRAGAFVIEGVAVAGSLALLVAARRASTALLGAAALVALVAYGATHPDIGQLAMSQLNRAAVKNLGNVRSEGHGYKLLDQRFYSTYDPPVLTPAEGLRFTARAIVAFVVVPLPWQMQSTAELMFLPQQMLWYVLLVCVPVGIVSGLRRDPVVTTMLVAHVVVGSIVIALNSGNVGTLIRHRDIAVTAVLWLIGLGGTVVFSRLTSAGVEKSAPPKLEIAEASCL